MIYLGVLIRCELFPVTLSPWTLHEAKGAEKQPQKKFYLTAND